MLQPEPKAACRFEERHDALGTHGRARLNEMAGSSPASSPAMTLQNVCCALSALRRLGGELVAGDAGDDAGQRGIARGRFGERDARPRSAPCPLLPLRPIARLLVQEMT